MNQIDKVLNSNERVVWSGRPNFILFLIKKTLLLFLLVALFFGLSYLSTKISGEHVSTKELKQITGFYYQGWVGLFIFVIYFIYNVLLYKNLYYFLTDKRIIIQKGIIGVDFDLVDFEMISNLEVRVGLLDYIFGFGKTGSIFLHSPGRFKTIGRNTYEKPYIIYSILQPYEIFKLIKKVSFDIKSDINFPNSLRTDQNEGYKTDYKSEDKF